MKLDVTLKPCVVWHNGYAFGVVTANSNGKCMWNKNTRIARLTREDALYDAQEIINDILAHSSL